MSTTYDDPDPLPDLDHEWARMYEHIQQVDGELGHVRRELVAVAAWDMTRQDHAAEDVMARLRQHLMGLDRALLVELVIHSAWPAAEEEAQRLSAQTRREIAVLDSPSQTALVPDPSVCPDPEGHAAQDRAASERAGGAPETSWWRRSRGLCAWCGRPIRRGGRHRA